MLVHLQHHRNKCNLKNMIILIVDTCEEDLMLAPDVEVFAGDWTSDSYRPSQAKMNAGLYWRTSSAHPLLVSFTFLI